jgi:hypothetical protein
VSRRFERVGDLPLDISLICLKIFRFFASFVEMVPENLEIKRTVSTEKEA